MYRRSFEDSRPFEREFKGIQKFEPISRSHECLVDVLQVGGGEEYFYYVMELADAAEPRAGDQCSVISDQFPQAATPASPGIRLNTDYCSLITSYSPKTLRAELRLSPEKDPYAFAVLHARLGHKDQALGLFEAARQVKGRGLILLVHDE